MCSTRIASAVPIVRLPFALSRRAVCRAVRPKAVCGAGHTTDYQRLPKKVGDYHDTVRKNAIRRDDLRKSNSLLKSREVRISELSAYGPGQDHTRKVTGSSPVTPSDLRHAGAMTCVPPRVRKCGPKPEGNPVHYRIPPFRNGAAHGIRPPKIPVLQETQALRAGRIAAKLA